MTILAQAAPTVKPLPGDLVAWLEERGHQVDPHTGKATRRPEFVVAPQPSPRTSLQRGVAQRYDAGFDAYCAGAYRDEVSHDPHMLRGWLAANAAEAEADMPGYAESMGW